MSGNASRYSHQPGRRYSQLVLGQGVNVTDADQREGMAIGLRNTTTLGDTSIRTGIPQTAGVVVWAEAADPSAHKIMTGIQPGKVVADGHVGEVRLAGDADLPDGAGLELLTLQQDLLASPELDFDQGLFVVYADLWHRHVGAAEDTRLVDPAFLSAETASRTELMAQLKVRRLEDALTDAELSARVQDSGLPRFGDFRLRDVTFAEEVVEPDNCDPCATTLDDPNQDAGNALFRLEVHASAFNSPMLLPSDTPARTPDDRRVLLKWSYDNGSTEVPVSSANLLLEDSAFDTAVFELTTVAAEQRLGLYTEEMTDRLATIHGRADIETALAAAPVDAFLRVWDGAVWVELSEGDLAVEPVGTLSTRGELDVSGQNWRIQLELGGLELVMEAQSAGDVPYVLPGDAWCVEVREYATETGDKLIWQQEPVEVKHFYAYVGLIEDGAFHNEAQPDMRVRAFPALTELDALDIAYDNTASEAEAWTVQGALDLLFARPISQGGDDCQCTFCVRPEEDLAEQLNRFAAEIAGSDIKKALICIPAGRYALTKPVRFREAEAVTMRGVGRELTTIELGELPSEDGALRFWGLESVRLEEMGFVGSMITSGKSFRNWVIGIHDVLSFEAWRVSVNVARDDGGLAHGISFHPEMLDEASTKATIHECAFRVGENAQAIGNWNGLTQLRVENNSFRSSVVDSFGGIRTLSAADDLVARTNVVRRTAEREAQIETGLYATYPGNSELLLNLTDLPPETRASATRYWGQALAMMEGKGEIGDPEEFEKVKGQLSTLNSASRTLVEAEVAVADKSAETGDFTFGATRLPVLNALVSTDDSAAFTALGAGKTTSGTSISAITSIMAAGGSIRPEDVADEVVTEKDEAAITQIKEANATLLGEATVADFAGRIAEILDNLVANPARRTAPNWGVFSFSNRAIQLQVNQNKFFDLDVSIDIHARRDGHETVHLSGPKMATLNDNVISQLVRLGELEAPVWGDGVDDDFIFHGRHPITLTNMQDVTIENNAVSQIMTGKVDDEFPRVIYESEFPEGSGSFTAISIYYLGGPKIRAVGNSAFNFRHCVYVNCTPYNQSFNDGQPKNNFWVYKENSSLPQPIMDLVRPAVELGKNARGRLSLVEMRMSDNWHPNPDFEK